MPDAPAPARRSSSKAMAIIVVVAVVAIVVIGWYWPAVSGAVAMQAWSKSGPRNAADAFLRAASSGDVPGLKAIADPGMTITESDGRATGIKRNKMDGSPTIPTAGLAPIGPTSEAPVTYDLKEGSPSASVTVQTEGGEIDLKLVHASGAWRVTEISPKDGAMFMSASGKSSQAGKRTPPAEDDGPDEDDGSSETDAVSTP